MRELRIGSWIVEPRLNRLRREGEEVVAEPRVVAFLAALAAARGEVLSKDELVERVWEGAAVSDDAILKTASKARAVLGDDAREPRYVETVRGVGYRLVPGAATEDTGAVVAPEPDLAPDLGRRRWWASALPWLAAAVLLVAALLLVGPEPAPQEADLPAAGTAAGGAAAAAPGRLVRLRPDDPVRAFDESGREVIPPEDAEPEGVDEEREPAAPEPTP